MMVSALEVVDFRKTHNGFVAVDGIPFDVRQGEIFDLPGPNAAGRTSTLESLEGLRTPDSGSLRVTGIDPTRESHKLRGATGVQLSLGRCLMHGTSLSPGALKRTPFS
ncbi:MAG TPA: ATP-binding cassette domain-containing protein [Actinobacteria bacterium]|nr:ATP-binding cassette domain-containing protein [Actinomycetota bacterium]